MISLAAVATGSMRVGANDSGAWGGMVARLRGRVGDRSGPATRAVYGVGAIVIVGGGDVLWGGPLRVQVGRGLVNVGLGVVVDGVGVAVAAEAVAVGVAVVGTGIGGSVSSPTPTRGGKSMTGFP